MANKITVAVTVATTLEKAWDCWTLPEHITHWNFASDDWHCPFAENDLKVGGKFLYRMAAKDKSMSFDFEGIYEKVILHQEIIYGLADGRKVQISFESTTEGIKVIETFDPENENPVEMQQTGWQLIMENYKKQAEKK